VVRETIAKTKLSAEKTKETCKMAVKVAKETYEDFKEAYTMDKEQIEKGGSMSDLPSKYKQRKTKVYEEEETPLVLEDVRIKLAKEDEALFKRLDELNNPVAESK
jgi:hypothetical protein